MMMTKLPPVRPADQSEADQKLILAALKGLKKKFEKRKWFAWAGQGQDGEGKFTLLVACYDKPSTQRINSCYEYMGMPVIIAGPFEEPTPAETLKQKRIRMKEGNITVLKRRLVAEKRDLRKLAKA